MTNIYYLGFLRPDQFATQPRPRRSKRRDQEFALVKKRGQERRVIVSTDGEVVAADIPLFEALIMARHAAIAVVFVHGRAEPTDIKAIRAWSVKSPLPECFRPHGKAPDPFQKYEQYLYAATNP
jgi:hypothetical protein